MRTEPEMDTAVTALFDTVRLHRGVILDSHLDIAAQQRDQDMGRTAEGNDGDFNAGRWI